jgi:hypothetical protein
MLPPRRTNFDLGNEHDAGVARGSVEGRAADPPWLRRLQDNAALRQRGRGAVPRRHGAPRGEGVRTHARAQWGASPP